MAVISFVLIVALCGGDAPQRVAERPQRLSIEAASARIADYIRTKKPGAQIDTAFVVDDLTTDAIWDQLHAQVVKVKEGQVEKSETFVLRGNKVERIGDAFGGNGVTSLVVADLAGDNKPLLVYSFAWGSGDHRSEIGILDLHGKRATELRMSPVNRSSDDYTVRRSVSGGVDVMIDKTVIGHVTAARERGDLHATIKLAEKLPDEIRRGLR
jgi:hypothetical protein